MHDEVVIWISSRSRRRLDQVLHSNLGCRRSLLIVAQVWLAGPGVDRRAPSSAHDLVDPMSARRIFVALDPVLEQVLVSRQQQLDVVLPEHRHVSLTNRERFTLDHRPAMWPGRKSRMMEEGDNVDVSPAIQRRELVLDPSRLN